MRRGRGHVGTRAGPGNERLTALTALPGSSLSPAAGWASDTVPRGVRYWLRTGNCMAVRTAVVGAAAGRASELAVIMIARTWLLRSPQFSHFP
jgi:hypothetical protein